MEDVEAAGGMGTVRPLADAISVEQADKAARKVREAIAQQQQQVEEFQKFKDENKSLSKLVLQLPDVVSHSIMVPFGKLAFFPGRLIHTNEFMVLLGGNHYAERSAKQTAEILRRRSKFLDTKIASSKANLADLEAEVSFITDTAEEAKAGLLEIREDYNEASEWQMDPISIPRVSPGAALSQPNSKSGDVTMGSEPVTKLPHASNQPASTSVEVIGGSELLTQTASSSTTAEDPAHDALMARLSEIELAEAAAADDDEDDVEDMDEEEDIDNDGQGVPALWSDLHRGRVSQKEPAVENSDSEEDDSEEDDDSSLLGGSEDEEDDNNVDMNIPGKEVTNKDPRVDVRNMGIRAYQKNESRRSKPLSRFSHEVHSASQRSSASELSASQHFLQLTESQKTQYNQLKSQSAASMEMSGMLENPGVSNDLTQELQEWRRGGANTTGHVLAERRVDNGSKYSSLQAASSNQRLSESAPAEAKAFTGTVVERGHGAPAGFPAFVGGITEHGYTAPTSSLEKQVELSQPSRPVSKFKMRQAQGRR